MKPPELDRRNRMDFRVFAAADPEAGALRRLRRDMNDQGRSLESAPNPCENTVRAIHREFVDPSRRWAEIMIPSGGHPHVAVDPPDTKMASTLAEA